MNSVPFAVLERKMAFPDRRTLDVLMTVLLVACVLTIVYLARTVIVIFLFAILFAYLIDPVVRFLQRHSLFFKNLRGPHVAEAYLTLLIVILLVVHVLAPGLLARTARRLKDVPVVVDRVYTGEIAADMARKYDWSDARTVRLKAFLVQHQTQIQGAIKFAERLAPRAIGAFVVIPILAIFFLSDGKKMADQTVQICSSRSNQAAVRSLMIELNTMLQHYIRAKVTLGCLSFAFCSAALLVLRFPHALILGVLAGILEFVPIAGWIASATTITIAGVLTHSHWIWMAALLGIWRLLMDYGISPRVMGHELEFHPLLAIFTVMVGGAVGGIVGIYLSIPLAAALRVLWRRLSVDNPESELKTSVPLLDEGD